MTFIMAINVIIYIWAIVLDGSLGITNVNRTPRFTLIPVCLNFDSEVRLPSNVLYS